MISEEEAFTVTIRKMTLKLVSFATKRGQGLLAQY
jgi:hypothetical protein